MKTIGVLALQGDFEQHFKMVQRTGNTAKYIRTISDIGNNGGLLIDGLIIPGGESTVIGKLLLYYQILPFLHNEIKKGLPVYGTCAGAILLANTIVDSDQIKIGGIDMVIERNSYGNQIDSFETDIVLNGINNTNVHAVFIRAPKIVSVSSDVKVLAYHEKSPVLVEQKNLMASTFHPELTTNTTIHDYFIEKL